MNRIATASPSNQNIGAGFVDVATIAAPASGCREYRLLIKLTSLNAAHAIAVRETQNAVVYLNKQVASGQTSALIEVSLRLAAGDNSYVVAINDSTGLSTAAAWTYELYELEDSSDVAKLLRPSGTEYFVGAGGDDSKNGLTWPMRKLTIGAAIALAASGDKINVGKGFYAERITASSKTLYIVGAGIESNGTIITGSGTGPTVALGPGSTIRDVKIAPAGGDTIVMEGNHGVRVTRCHLVTATSNATAYNSIYNREVIEDSILEAPFAISADGSTPQVLRSRLVGAVVGSPICFECIPNLLNAAPDVLNGEGDIPVDHNSGGIDALRYTVAGQPADNVTIKAYLTSEYNAGTRTVRGTTYTGPDGRWLQPLMLNSGSYTLVAWIPGVSDPKATVIAVA